MTTHLQSMSTDFAWVTLATNDTYALGALVLAHSLRRVHTKYHVVVLITPGVSNAMHNHLRYVFDLVQSVDALDSGDEKNLNLLNRPELGITLTKLHCWRLVQYTKCVFLDADTLVLKNCDELYDREELSAAPDIGWPDCFNTGVFVYRPSLETFDKLVQFSVKKGSFDGGDQGLLNLFFAGWAHTDITKHLPFIYNMCSSACYSYLPAFKQFGAEAKIVHFIGPVKPWLQYFDTKSDQVHPSSEHCHLRQVLQLWWDLFRHCVHPNLNPEMSGLAYDLSALDLGEWTTDSKTMMDDRQRRHNWEHGIIDYRNTDSFDKIWSRICDTMSVDGDSGDKNSTASGTK